MITLEKLERGIQTILTDQFARITMDEERDITLRATIITTVAGALGETLGSVEYPRYWQRFLKRKDCPKYLKEIVTSNINAYYPKLALPEEEHWVSFETPITIRGGNGLSISKS